MGPCRSRLHKGAKGVVVTTDVSADRLARVHKAVADWVRQLMDLTGRNQLLYYRTLERGTLDLAGADPTAVRLLLAGRQVRLSHLFKPAVDQDAFDDAARRAGAIHRKAVELFEERGIQTLFVAWGMATWTTTTSSATPNAPVLLHPLVMKPRGAAESDFDVDLDDEGEWQINETLMHLLATDFRVTVDAEALVATLETDSSVEPPDPTRLFERLAKEADDVPDFAVTDRQVAGTFQYTKLPMVNDLNASVAQLAAHDLIAAIAGDDSAKQAVLTAREHDIDPSLPDVTPPTDEFLILDSDASQNYAINSIVAGEPLVIQGPPGTGKSQTIANLIATLTARGKRVLFVAEKRAAIDAVTKRLRQVGLGDLVMDMHGGVTSKRQMAADIASTLDKLGRTSRANLDEVHRTLENTRQHLLEHVRALHTTRHPWGVSVYDVQTRLVEIGDDVATNLRFTASRLEDLDADATRDARELLGEYVDLATPILEGRTGWAGARVHTERDAREALDLVSDLAHQTLPDTRAKLAEVVSDTGLPMPDSVDRWRRTLALLTAMSATFATFAPDVLDKDLDGLVDALSPASRRWWSRMVAQLFNGHYRAAKKELRAVWISDDEPAATDMYRAIEAARDQVSEWTALGGTGAPRLPDGLAEAGSAFEDLTGELAGLGAYLVTRDLTDVAYEQLPNEVGELLADQHVLLRLPRIHEIETWLEAHHCRGLLDKLRDGSIDRSRAADVFEHAWLASIRQHLTASDRALANFDGTLHSRRAAEFRQADVEHRDYTPPRVQRAIAEAAYVVRNAHPDQSQLVEVQARRKRGHLTIRNLFAQASDVLTALRPCWVMSPLVVSQTLPARQLFDVVIFDEASQVRPADAIPALLRAPQAVVAGDSRQLPPTTFFDTADEAADEDDDIENLEAGMNLTTGFESILDVLGSLLREQMLTWHYRSEDERLIAYSNVNIYKGALTTFPGVAGEQCLRHVLVPHRAGVSVDTRSSDAEVAAVVDLMVDHARTRPDETMGVIAMGQYHADRVDAALRARLKDAADPELNSFFEEGREERAFVKNLERVQGDERDAIILTVGYGKSTDGRLLYRFGPLLYQGGERRLNVAVTRARRRMTVVSSFSHADMHPSRSSAEGIELLRRYLKYVETGGRELEGAAELVPLNPFELSILRRLEDAGLKVQPQYGASRYRIDFAICHPDEPGRMVLAIEADGASYHSAETARDRDRLRQQVLERLGWRFHRIWSTDWFNDPDAEMAKVLDAYEQALDGHADDVDADAEPADDEPWVWEFEVPDRDGRRPVEPGSPIGSYSHAQLVRLARWILSDSLLRTDDQLRAEMMRELGFRRKGKRIISALDSAIADVRRR